MKGLDDLHIDESTETAHATKEKRTTTGITRTEKHGGLLPYLRLSHFF